MCTGWTPAPLPLAVKHCDPEPLSWLPPPGLVLHLHSVGTQRKSVCPSQGPYVSSRLSWTGHVSCRGLKFSSWLWGLSAVSAAPVCVGGGGGQGAPHLSIQSASVWHSVHLCRCLFSSTELISFLFLLRLYKQKPWLELTVWRSRMWRALGT